MVQEYKKINKLSLALYFSCLRNYILLISSSFNLKYSLTFFNEKCQIIWMLRETFLNEKSQMIWMLRKAMFEAVWFIYCNSIEITFTINHYCSSVLKWDVTFIISHDVALHFASINKEFTYLWLVTNSWTSAISLIHLLWFRKHLMFW